MDEVKFVLKCFVFTCLIFALSQIQLENGQTIEAQVHGFLVSSSTAKFVNESARGGAKLANNAYKEFSNYVGIKKVDERSKARPIHSAVIKKTEKTYIDHDSLEEDFDQRLSNRSDEKEKVDTLEDIDLE